MDLNDEQEKLNQAREWLFTRVPGSQEWDAAWFHVQWVAGNDNYSPELRLEARRIMEAKEAPN